MDGINETEKIKEPGSETTTGIVQKNESLESEVQEVLSGQESQQGAKTKVEAPYGFTREGEPKKRNYPPRKKNKKRTVRKPFKPKATVADIIPKTEKTEGEKSYADYKAEYDQSLDPDARNPAGEERVVDNPNNIAAEHTTEKPKRKYGNSLVVITQFVLPVFCSLAMRIVSRGKKKPDSTGFRLDDFEKEMLKELADDGAGEEILGRINPALVFGIVAVAIGANKVMDAWDKDMFEEKMKEMNELTSRFNELEAKYNQLAKPEIVDAEIIK